MKNLKHILIIIVLIFVGILDILIYRNNHHFYRAEKEEDSVRKVKILEDATDFYPSNDLIYYELGRAYFDLAVKNLEEGHGSGVYLQKSIKTSSSRLNASMNHA